MKTFDRFKVLKGGCKPVLAGGVVLSAALLFLLPVAPEPAVAWVAVSSQQLEHEIGLVGKIEPIETALVTAPFEAVALANKLSPGLQVEQGQALLSLDTALLEIKIRDALASKLRMQQVVELYRAWSTGPEVRQARQMLRIAELSMQTLDVEFAQVEALYQKGIVARNERDALKQQRSQQLLELKAAQAQLKDVLAAGTGEARTIAAMEYQNASVAHEQLNALLEKKTLHAPFSGVVLALGAPQLAAGEAGTLHQGTLFAKGQQLIKLANTSGFKVVSLVAESDVNKFVLNQKVTISGDGFKGRKLSGYVSAISQLAVADESAGSAARFAITVTVNSPESGEFMDVRLGMSAHMTIVTYRNDNSYIIPHAAVEQAGNTSFVQHRESLDGPVMQREVTIGQSTAEGVEVFGLESGFVSVKTPTPTL